MSIIGVPMVMGPIMGPVIGGLIVSNFSWRWIFYINVPIGIITLILSQPLAAQVRHRRAVQRRFDTLGFCLLSPGLAALVYSLSEVGTTGCFTSTSVLVSFVLGVVLMVGFILHALRTRSTRCSTCTRSRTATSPSPTCASSSSGATLFGSMFLLPLYYQIARGQRPGRPAC